MTESSVSRRTALKFAGVIALVAEQAFASSSQRPKSLIAHGYGTDPNLLKRTVTWPKILTSSQLATLRILADIILPADPPHPSAADIGVHDFLDEWLSAPYPDMRQDRTLILTGLGTLNEMALRRFGISFLQVQSPQQAGVFDLSCVSSKTAVFAQRLIELVCGGYYTTREGHAAIGYAGNVGLTSFPQPSPELVSHLDEALNELLSNQQWERP